MQKVIVISGGSDGLGKEIAAVLSPHNIVVILSRNKDKLAEVANGLHCDFEVCDAGIFEQAAQAINNIVTKHDGIDVLINCAGRYLKGKLEETDAMDIEEAYRTNALGTIYLTKAVIPVMKKKNDGQIINIITQGGLPGFGKAERSIYYSSKMAITSFTKSISLELLPFNIRVTGVYPGKINTRFMEKQGSVSDMSDAIDPKEIAQMVSTVVNLPSTVHIPELGIKSAKQVS